MGQPIWGVLAHQGRTLVWLSKRTGYSHSHILAIKAGKFPAQAGFRAKCVAALDIPEHLLFHPVAEQTADSSAA